MAMPVFFTRRRFAALIALVLVASCTPARDTRAQAGPDVRPLAPDYAISGQLQPQDMRRLAAQGYSLVIDNRPDGESPDQPSSAEMAKAAKRAGLDFVYLPIRPGHYTPADMKRLNTILAGHKGKTVAYCRSGTRATTLWSLAQTERGALAPDKAIAVAARAGIDLRGQRQRLQELARQARP